MSSVPHPIHTDSAVRTALAETSDSGATVSWQRELSGAIRTVDELLCRLNLLLPGESIDAAAKRLGLVTGKNPQGQSFPVLVPENFLQRMVPGDAADPLLRQVLPLAEESLAADGYVADPVGDLSARRVPGVLQKYHGRVLLIATSTCAVHCRYCFRREYPYDAEPRRLDDWQPAIDEIAADPSITEVIFSGGDPWMLNDHRLAALCESLDSIAHLERIRFHTRLPIVLPSRVTPELVGLLTSLRAQPILVVHANHANEIAGDCESVLRSLVRSGLTVLNQAVLLAGVNDSVDALERLCRRLVNVGVMPYYLHQLDQVNGTAHFKVKPEVGQELLRQLAARLPGYAVPRYVQEIAGESGKTPIL